MTPLHISPEQSSFRGYIAHLGREMTIVLVENVVADDFPDYKRVSNVLGSQLRLIVLA